jgi:NADH-quinone oxidoreductase subunit N
MHFRMFLDQAFENNFKLFLPEFFLSAAILTLILYGSISFLPRNFNVPLIANSTCYLSLLILGGTTSLVFSSKDVCCLAFNGIFISDILSQNTKLLMLFGAIATLFINLSFTEHFKINSFEYFLLFLLSIFGLMFLSSSFDLLSVYLAIELQSLCLYVLASFLRQSAYSTEAGLKYFILGASSSSLLLFGFSVLYGFSGITRFDALNTLFFLEVEKNLILQIVISFIICALFFKIALAPFHIWSPDIYEGSPLNSTIFFALVPKIAFVVVFLRIFLFCFGVQFYFWQILFVFCSLASIFIGSFSALKQRKLKRLFAFSSISHFGYIFLAISSFSVQGIHAAIFYLLVYTIMSSGIWSLVSCLDFFFTVHRPRTISDLLYIKSNPTLAISSVIFFFSMAGIPPFIGFLIKYCVFLSTIQISFYVISINIILISLLSTYYYIRCLP